MRRMNRSQPAWILPLLMCKSVQAQGNYVAKEHKGGKAHLGLGKQISNLSSLCANSLTYIMATGQPRFSGLHFSYAS